MYSPRRGGRNALLQGDWPVAPTGDGYSFVGFRFGVLWGGGWRWKTPGGRCPCHTAQSESAAPITVQRGFGRPGAGGRYRPAALKCSTYHGLVRAGCPRWLLRGWLYCPPEADVPRQRHSRAPGPAVGPYRRNMSNVASATRSRAHQRLRLESGGAPRTSRLGPAPPRGHL